MFIDNELFDTKTEVIWRDLARLTEKDEVPREDINRMFAGPKSTLN